MARYLSVLIAAFVFGLINSHGEQPQLELLAKDAVLKNDVKYNPQGDYIFFWSGPGSSLTWKLDNVEPGTYSVTIVYSLQGDRGKRQFNIPSGSDTKKIATLLPTGGWNTFKNKMLVPLTIAKTDTSFSITAVEIPPSDYLMNLQKVILKKTF